MSDARVGFTLTTFRLSKFHMELDRELPEGSSPGGVSFAYKTGKSPAHPQEHIFMLTVTCEPRPATEDNPIQSPYICSEIEGHFLFSEAYPEQQLHKDLRYVGANMLYGILRGVVAGMSGAFVPGQTMLPTVNMRLIIDTLMESEKELSESKPISRPELKQVSPRTTETP